MGFYTNKKVLVMGMKASGISAATLLKKLGAFPYCYDDTIRGIQGYTFVHSVEDEFLKGIDFIIVSPSIAKTHPILLRAKELRITIRSELDFGCSLLRCPQIMVTGTNGKTTVVSMIEKMLLLAGLKVKAIGNIGYPVTQTVADDTDLDFAIIEASSFQLEYATVDPYISVVLNLAPDHMDRYATYAEYVEEKKKVCRNQTPDEYFIFNADDGAARRFVSCTQANSIPISVRNTRSAVYIKDKYFMYDDVSLCPVKCCRLRGEHNKFNLLIALNVGAIVGVGKDAMVKLIKEYAVLPNRIEYVTTLDKKNYFNDSKGTNIHACRFAIASMDGTVGLIMGGSDKNEDFCDFFESIDEKVKWVAVTGGNAAKIYNSAMKMGYTNITVRDTLAEAVRFLSEKEDVTNVLLSPCCASFDRYKNYAERGEKFKEAVYAIGSNSK